MILLIQCSKPTYQSISIVILKLTIQTNKLRQKLNIQIKLQQKMLIQQIIRKQTIGFLDRILKFINEENSQNKDRHTLNQDMNEDSNLDGNNDTKNINEQSLRNYSIQEYTALLKQKGILKDDQKQMLTIILKKHVECMLESNQDQQSIYKFDDDQAKKMLQQIKRSIIGQDKSSNQNQSIKYQQKDKKYAQISSKTALPNLEVNQFAPETSQNRQKQIQPKTQQLSNQNKNLKMKNKFISRNINKIKSYSTSTQNTAIIGIERSQLQQMKISHQISHKLFQIYKHVYPQGTINNRQIQLLNFDNKQQYKSTLNYHKVMQMFSDGGIKLEIQNKLSLLRIIKKFSFNQNFIVIQEWTKVYRAIINSLGIKEVLLQRLVKFKQEEKRHGKPLPLNPNSKLQRGYNSYSTKKPQRTQDSYITNKAQRNQDNYSTKRTKDAQHNLSDKKAQRGQDNYRTKRIKTQAQIAQQRLIPQRTMVGCDMNNTLQCSRFDYLINKSGIRPLQLNTQNQEPKPNPNQYRIRHKKLLTDICEVTIKNIKKQLKSEKMVGIINKKYDGRLSTQETLLQQRKGQHSYLRKAITNKKISKVTWETLFQMKQQTILPEIYFNRLSDQLNTSIYEEFTLIALLTNLSRKQCAKLSQIIWIPYQIQ